MLEAYQGITRSATVRPVKWKEDTHMHEQTHFYFKEVNKVWEEKHTGWKMSCLVFKWIRKAGWRHLASVMSTSLERIITKWHHSQHCGAVYDKISRTSKNNVFFYSSIFRQWVIYTHSYRPNKGGLAVIWKSICFPLWSIRLCWCDEEAIMRLKLSSSVNTSGDALCNSLH